MEFSAQQIAAVLGGTLYGNSNAKVSDVAPIEQAQACHLTFITDEKYLPFLEKTKAGVILITRSVVEGKITFPDQKLIPEQFENSEPSVRIFLPIFYNVYLIRT